MVSLKAESMGRFSVDIELANNGDLALSEHGFLPAEQVRRTRIRGVVDSGATRMVLPKRVADSLGLRQVGEVNVKYADGRMAIRPLVGNIQLSCLGRSSVFNAIVEPNRDSALIGAIVLEDLDLIVDCTHQTLAPRDPKQIVSEIE